MIIIRILSIAGLALFLLSSPALSQVPRSISYQGVLLDNTRQPKPDGSYDFAFTVKDGSGAVVWSGPAVGLMVSNGFFSTKLGPFSDTVCFDKPLYLDVTVDGTPLTPRVELLPALYSLSAVCAQSAQTAAEALHAATADEAIHADSADRASHAESARLADEAVEAQHSLNSDHAVAADSAARAVFAFNGVPVGTIIAYYGEVTDSLPNTGWLLCDGKSIVGSRYPAFVQLVGSTKPDLRAMFLRGANADRADQFRDPDVNSASAAGRTLSSSGHSGSVSGQKIGSVQSDTLAVHAHGIHPTASSVRAQDPSNRLAAGRQDSPNPTGFDRTNTEGGLETRPNNVYINWLIKAW